MGETASADGPESANPLVGAVLGGHYEILGRLGAGAHGTVYLARHSLLGEEFAVKVIRPERAGDADARRRFLAEAATLARIASPHAVQVRHCGEEGGRLYLVEELVRGETLAERLRRESRLPWREAAHLGVQVLEALEAAHRAGVVHRDLKPANILLESRPGPDGAAAVFARVADFGLARAIPGTPGNALLESRSGTVAGTAPYMSPEQIRASPRLDGRSNLFSLGVVLHEMVAGRRPFDSDDPLSVALRILETPPDPLTPDVREAPDSLRRVLDRALLKDPEARYATAGEMARDLRAALGNGPEATGPPSSPRRRVPARAVAVLALLGAAAAAAALAASRGGDGDAPERDPGAALWRDAGDFAAAFRAYDDAIREDPRSVDLRAARARMLLDDEAPEAYEGLAEPVRALADRDAWFVESEAPQDARGSALRAALLLRIFPGETDTPPETVRAARLLAERAATADPRLAAGPRIVGDSWTREAMSSRAAGDSAETQRRTRLALDAYSEALRRAESFPGYRDQGRERARLLGSRAGAYFNLEQFEACLRDLRAAVEHGGERRGAYDYGWGLKYAGRFEDAIPWLEKAHAFAAGDDPRSVDRRKHALLNAAFCRQRLGEERLEAGDESGAASFLRDAVATYDRAEPEGARGSALDFVYYRAEARTLLAAAEPAAAAAHLEAAGRDFERAEESFPDPVSHLLCRRAHWKVVRGDPEGAAADSRRAAVLQPDAPFQEGLARVLLHAAASRAAAGDSDGARARLAEAEAACDRGMAASLPRHGNLLLLRGRVLASAAALEGEGEARSVLLRRAAASFREAGERTRPGSGVPEAARRAREEVDALSLAPGDPARSAAERAAAARRAGLAAGDWTASSE